MNKFKIGDLVNIGMTSAGTQWLVMPVVRLTKTLAVCQVGQHVERINNTTGRIHGRVGMPATLWDGKQTRRPLRYPEVSVRESN